MSITYAQLIEHESAIRALFRTWVLRDEIAYRKSCPDWMSPEEYELLHQCVRETYEILSEKGVF